MAQATQAKAKALVYKYLFTLKDGQTKEFTVSLEPDTLAMQMPKRDSYPEWTKLEHRKCSNCPLKEAEHPQCPAAVSLIDVVATFGSSTSHDGVKVRVEGEDRSYEKEVPLQKGVSGLMGLLMATSGCPVLEHLRPLTRYHLPFSDLLETRFRILSMYLIAQYLIQRKGGKPDWLLEGLKKIYGEIQTVNQHFTRRLLTTAKGDANPNALVILSAFGDAVTFSVEGKMLEELEQMFRAYLEGARS